MEGSGEHLQDEAMGEKLAREIISGLFSASNNSPYRANLHTQELLLKQVKSLKFSGEFKRKEHGFLPEPGFVFETTLQEKALQLTEEAEGGEHVADYYVNVCHSKQILAPYTIKNGKNVLEVDIERAQIPVSFGDRTVLSSPKGRIQPLILRDVVIPSEVCEKCQKNFDFKRFVVVLIHSQLRFLEENVDMQELKKFTRFRGNLQISSFLAFPEIQYFYYEEDNKSVKTHFPINELIRREDCRAFGEELKPSTVDFLGFQGESSSYHGIRKSKNTSEKLMEKIPSSSIHSMKLEDEEFQLSASSGKKTSFSPSQPFSTSSYLRLLKNPLQLLEQAHKNQRKTTKMAIPLIEVIKSDNLCEEEENGGNEDEGKPDELEENACVKHDDGGIDTPEDFKDVKKTAPFHEYDDAENLPELHCLPDDMPEEPLTEKWCKNDKNSTKLTKLPRSVKFIDFSEEEKMISVTFFPEYYFEEDFFEIFGNGQFLTIRIADPLSRKAAFLPEICVPFPVPIDEASEQLLAEWHDELNLLKVYVTSERS